MSISNPALRISRSLMASLNNYTLRQRRFAPLLPSSASSSSAPPLRGIVFDVDGTLWYTYTYTLLATNSTANQT